MGVVDSVAIGTQLHVVALARRGHCFGQRLNVALCVSTTSVADSVTLEADVDTQIEFETGAQSWETSKAGIVMNCGWFLVGGTTDPYSVPHPNTSWRYLRGLRVAGRDRAMYRRRPVYLDAEFQESPCGTDRVSTSYEAESRAWQLLVVSRVAEGRKPLSLLRSGAVSTWLLRRNLPPRDAVACSRLLTSLRRAEHSRTS